MRDVMETCAAVLLVLLLLAVLCASSRDGLRLVVNGQVYTLRVEW